MDHLRGLRVIFPGGTRRSCQSVLSLVRSFGKSSTQAIGDGFRVVTTAVRCAASAEDDTEYDIQAFSDLSHVTDFQMDPPRGHGKEGRMAAVRVTAIDGTEITVEGVQLIDADMEHRTHEEWQALCELTAGTRFATTETSRKRVTFKDTEASPWTSGRKSRKLDRYPTEPGSLHH